MCVWEALHSESAMWKISPFISVLVSTRSSCAVLASFPLTVLLHRVEPRPFLCEGRGDILQLRPTPDTTLYLLKQACVAYSTHVCAFNQNNAADLRSAAHVPSSLLYPVSVAF